MKTYKKKKLRQRRSKYVGMSDRQICADLYKNNEIVRKIIDKFDLKLL